MVTLGESPRLAAAGGLIDPQVYRINIRRDVTILFFMASFIVVEA